VAFFENEKTDKKEGRASELIYVRYGSQYGQNEWWFPAGESDVAVDSSDAPRKRFLKFGFFKKTWASNTF
jgi:hypothetical protein